jgi:hypothetical protein
MPPGPTEPFAIISHSFAARGAVQSCLGAEEAIDNVRGPTPHASRVNGIVSVEVIPWRFTYLCWNIPGIGRSESRRLESQPSSSENAVALRTSPYY